MIWNEGIEKVHGTPTLKESGHQSKFVIFIFGTFRFKQKLVKISHPFSNWYLPVFFTSSTAASISERISGFSFAISLPRSMKFSVAF